MVQTATRFRLSHIHGTQILPEEGCNLQVETRCHVWLTAVLSYLGVFAFRTCKILICLVVLLQVLSCLVCNCYWLAVCIVVVILCVFAVLCVHCWFFFTLDTGLLARSQYSEGPATGHLDIGFFRFPCVYKQTLRRFPTLQVATTRFSCSPPDLNLVVTNFMFCTHVKITTAPG